MPFADPAGRLQPKLELCGGNPCRNVAWWGGRREIHRLGRDLHLSEKAISLLRVYTVILIVFGLSLSFILVLLCGQVAFRMGRDWRNKCQIQRQ